MFFGNAIKIDGVKTTFIFTSIALLITLRFIMFLLLFIFICVFYRERNVKVWNNMRVRK